MGHTFGLGKMKNISAEISRMVIAYFCVLNIKHQVKPFCTNTPGGYTLRQWVESPTRLLVKKILKAGPVITAQTFL